MGSMCRGSSASVSVITHTSLQDTAGRSLRRRLCLLSVSPSRLNAFDCTVHHQAEVFAHRWITRCTPPSPSLSLSPSAQGAREEGLRAVCVWTRVPVLVRADLNYRPFEGGQSGARALFMELWPGPRHSIGGLKGGTWLFGPCWLQLFTRAQRPRSPV